MLLTGLDGIAAQYTVQTHNDHSSWSWDPSDLPAISDSDLLSLQTFQRLLKATHLL